MCTRINATLIAAAAASAVIAIGSPLIANAQQQGARLHGHWSLESTESVAKDGTRTPGQAQKGLFIFDPSGRYSIQLYRVPLPKFASNNRQTGTDAENKAVVQGSLAHFGTYKVDDKAGTFTILAEASSFPNWTGVEQPPRKFIVAGDKLTIINPAPSAGSGTSELTLKRLK